MTADPYGDDHGSEANGPDGLPRRLTRREALRERAAGVVVVGALGRNVAPKSRQEHRSQAAGRREMSFDKGWRFSKGDSTSAKAPGFDDGTWRRLDLPHDRRIEDLPHPTSHDGGATSNPSTSAFVTRPSPDGTVPEQIGAFDADAGAVKNAVHSGGRTQGYTVGGIGWYRKRFTVPGLDRRGGRRDKRRVEVRFDGVYQNADFYLNGVRLGSHPNGYTPALLDLTPHLRRSGQNVLAVRVDARGETSRWYAGCGIYRHTTLIVTGPVRIPAWSVFVTTPVVGKARSVVAAEVRVKNSAALRSAKVRVGIHDAHGRRVASHTTPAQALAAGEEVVFRAKVPVNNAALWSPASPKMYFARAEIGWSGKVVDSVDTKFGIRELAWNAKKGFLFNGKPMKIRGGCIHHDHGPLGALALGRSEERTIEVLQRAGFNAIRTAHNPPPELLLEACDRLGMLVWDEFTDIWAVAANKDDYHKDFPDWWKRDLTRMVLRDRNHPSVIIWSLGNEIEEDPGDYGPRLAARVRSLDRTRPVTVSGTNVAYGDVADVHCGNLWPQLFGVRRKHTALIAHSSYPTRAITQSEGFPATIFQDWQLAATNPWFVGNWVWTAWDYMGEAGLAATPVGRNRKQAAAFAGTAVDGMIPYPWYPAFSGDIDLIGERRPQSYWRAVVYGRSTIEMLVERPSPSGKKQFAALWGYYDELKSWTWEMPEGHPMKVRVYTSGNSVRLLLNGEQIAARVVSDKDERTTTFTVPYAPYLARAGAGDPAAEKEARNSHALGERPRVADGAPEAPCPAGVLAVGGLE